MKKAWSILTLTMLLVSACSADVGLDVGGELLPDGNGGGNQGGGSIFSNPVVIALLVILGVVLIILLVSVAGKQR